jgi:hypothetical protein
MFITELQLNIDKQSFYNIKILEMKKFKFAVLLSIICVFIGGFAKAQNLPIVVTRTDIDGTAPGLITINIKKATQFETNMGTQSFSNGTTANFQSPSLSYGNGMLFNVSYGGNTSAYYPMPTVINGNAQEIVFDYGTYSIYITLWRTGTYSYTVSTVKAVPIG